MTSKADYVALSDFRFRLAKFLSFSENAAKRAGVTPSQYLLMLHIGGTPDRDWATVGELAERLQASHHGTVSLVQRSEINGYVTKRRNPEDSRLVEVRLTPQGRRLLERIASQHKDELHSLRGTFRVRHINRKTSS